MTLETSERPGRLLAYTLAIWLLLAFGASPALGAPAVSQRIDITGLFQDNECTGEGVELSGSLHIVTHVTANADGSFRVKVHTNTQGVTGTGILSGDRYSFNEGYNLMSEVDVLAGGSGHFVGHEEFIHHGESGGLVSPTLDDQHVHFNVTVALDASGLPTTTFIPRIECR